MGDQGDVELFFDPACPWTWTTSRWLVEVAAARGFHIHWRSFSLWHRNEWTGNTLSAEHCERLLAQYPALRVLEATNAAHGNEAMGALYAAIGRRIHVEGDRLLVGLADALAECGLPGDLAAAADDGSFDAVIDASTRAATDLVGTDVGIPVIARAGRVTFSGPVLTHAPTGDAALRLWDAFAALGEFDGLYEIKRSRP